MLNEALQKVVAALDKLEIPYALIGGLAVAARGALPKTSTFLLQSPFKKRPPWNVP